ncbi:MAG: benzodiazapine receptor [Crocinitomicaceae bacterium]|jgi:benzodiazapine receptor
MARLKLFSAFFILNFGALFIGGLFTGSGVSSDWYNELNQAPWTPAGWVFGVAWTSIMLCFSFYMSAIYLSASSRKRIVALFAIQWILNVSWNPLFFYLHFTGIALVAIVSLTLVVAYFLYAYRGLRFGRLLILPYLIWLVIASSLNAYIFFNN